MWRNATRMAEHGHRQFGREPSGLAIRTNEILVVMGACRRYFVTAAVFSLGINLLYLASPLYMMQVYDRVISSGSHVTLIMLTLAMLLAFAALAGLDWARAGILTRASVRLDRLLAARVVAATIEQSARGGRAPAQMLREFDTFRQFMTGHGIHAVFDLPWTPIYILVIFILHPALGIFAFVSAAVLIVMAFLNEIWVHKVLAESNEAATLNYNFTDMSVRNSQVIQAMGIMPGLLLRWVTERGVVLARQQTASERSAMASAAIRFLRLAMQSLILGLGAYLVIERVTSVGAIFAASILLGRALQPVEQIVGSWRGFIAARVAYRRILALLEANPLRMSVMTLPKPEGRLAAEGVGAVVPGAARPILHGVSFAVEPGEVICIVGPSGAGKSTLARHIVGVAAPSAGVVRLDGADVASRPRAVIGNHIGYLPQDIELFADTVAANICRFSDDGDDLAIVRAARMAGVHDMILRLPDGYETQIGERGAILSGGYRQRIALARAVYGEPSLVVLDEPSSNLDGDGDLALAECVRRLKEKGTTVVIISHRPATIGLVDKILVLRGGTVQSFGPRDDVLRGLSRNAAVHLATRSVVGVS